MDAMNITENPPGAAAPVADAAAVTNQQALTAENAADQAAQQTQDEGKPEADKPEEKTPKWAQRRINQLTSEKYRERAAREHLEQRLAEIESRLLAGQQDDAHQPQRREPPVDINVIRESVRFDERCNAVAEQGKAAFPDFDEAMSTLASVGVDERALRVLVEAEQPARLIHYLGKNPNEAAELLSLPPVAMARRIGALEAKIAAKPPPKVSSAPDPVKPLAAKSASDSDEPSDRDSMQEWLRKREAQIKARGGR